MLATLLALAATALAVQTLLLVVICACGCCFLCLETFINVVRPLVRVPTPLDLLPDIYLSSVSLGAAATLEPVGNSDATASSLLAPVVIVSAVSYFLKLSDRAVLFRDLVRVGCTTALAGYWEPTFAADSEVDLSAPFIVAVVLYALAGLVNCGRARED